MFFCICIFVLYQFFLFAQLRAGQFTKLARAYLKKAERLGNQGILVEQAIFYKRAVKLLAQAIKANPLDAGSYFAYAESINSKIGQDEALIKLLELERLGPLASSQNLSPLALVGRNYTEAIKREPTNAIYHQRLASVYEKLSQDDQAEAELKKAVFLDPQNVSIHLYLTKYYLSRNKESEFNYHLGRVVELYKRALTGGGPMERLGNMVYEYLVSINREGLLKN
jgi:tetratricopeptide (TPR) repeat protein